MMHALHRLFLAVSALCLAAAGFAKAPDWVTNAIADSKGWRTDSVAQLIYRSRTVRFVTPDLRHVVIIERGVVHSRTTHKIPNYSPALYHPTTGKLVSAEGWELGPDAKTTDSFSQHDFYDVVASFNHYFWYADRVILLPRAEQPPKDGYVAWEIQTEEECVFGQSEMSFASQLAAYRQDFEIDPPAGGKLAWTADRDHIPAPVPGATAGSLRWTVYRVPPTGLNLPTGFLPSRLSVVARCIPAAADEKLTWRDLGTAIAAFSDPQVIVSPAVRAAAASATAGKTTRWERVRALTEFTQRQIVYLSVDLDKDAIEGMRPHSSETVLQNRYGDCKDKANLLVALLRASGDDGREVLLDGAADPAGVDPTWPANYFNHAIVAIPADADTPPDWPIVQLEGAGRFVIFDPTSSRTPLGVIPRSDEAGYALLVDPQHAQIFQLPTPDPEKTRLVRRTAVTIDADGNATVSVRDEFSGNTAAEMHARRLAGTKDDFGLYLAARIHEFQPTARLGEWSDEWHEVESHYHLGLDFTVSSLGRLRSNGMMTLAPQVYTLRGRPEPWETKAAGKVFLPAESVDEEVKLTLPAGYHVEEEPDPWKLDLSSMALAVSYANKGNTETVTVSQRRPAAFYSEPEYREVRGAYLKLLESLKRPLLLTKDSPPAS